MASGVITGLVCDHDPDLSAMAWYCDNTKRGIHGVAQKDASSWGLYDMPGKVRQWCQEGDGEYLPAPQGDRWATCLSGPKGAGRFLV